MNVLASECLLDKNHIALLTSPFLNGDVVVLYMTNEVYWKIGNWLQPGSSKIQGGDTSMYGQFDDCLSTVFTRRVRLGYYGYRSV